MNIRIAVRAVILDDDGKLFCVRLKAYKDKTQPENDYWCLPGGGIYENEALKTALHREMIEETAVAPEIGELLYVQQYFDGKQQQIEFFFHVTNAHDYLDIDLAEATHAEEEIAEYGFVNPGTTYILPDFLTKENIAEHIASNSPAKIFSYL